MSGWLVVNLLLTAVRHAVQHGVVSLLTSSYHRHPTVISLSCCACFLFCRAATTSRFRRTRSRSTVVARAGAVKRISCGTALCRPSRHAYWLIHINPKLNADRAHGHSTKGCVGMGWCRHRARVVSMQHLTSPRLASPLPRP